MLDIGSASADEVRERGIEIGDSIVPYTPFTQLSEHRYTSKAWDNRYGCPIGIELLEMLQDVELDVDLYVGANVQEEVGLRGARPSAELIDPTSLLSLIVHQRMICKVNRSYQDKLVQVH